MTRWYADAIEDIEAWQRGAPIRVLRPGWLPPVSRRFWPVSELAGICQPSPRQWI